MLAALLFTATSLTLVAAQSQFTRPAEQAGAMRFRDMDRNNDGVVTRAEWRGSERSFRVHDWNRDGILSGDEVRPGANRPDTSDQTAGIREDREDTFENLDVNGDGRVDGNEWHGSADAFGWLDRNGDGALSRSEIVGRPAVQERRQPVRRNRREPAAAAANQDCVDNAPRVVDDIFQQVLERSADPTSAPMAQDLAAGRTTVRALVGQLAKSPEHAQRFFWEPIVLSLYRQILSRDPSAQERRDTASDLATGQRSLPELIARTARRATSNDEDAVRILYRRLLGREADPEGLRDFTAKAGSEGIESVARDIVASAEYRQRVGPTGLQAADLAAYETAVRSLYRHVLGRDPDPEGIRDLTQLATVYGLNGVVDRMLASAEYEQLWGSNVVPGRGIRYCGTSRP